MAYNHPWPPEDGNKFQVNNLHQAMQYDTAGRPVIRTITTTGPGAAGSTSAFGESLSVPLTPVIQLDGIYGIDQPEFERYTAASGNVGVTGSLMEVSTGTSANGYGVLRSKRSLRYRPGQGAVTRFTAKFSTPVAGTTQRAGFFNQEQALQIGYDGSDFGILRASGGKAHIHCLEITTPAGPSSETLTLILNDHTVVVSLTTSTIAGNSYEIANAIKNDAIANASWTIEYSSTKVCIVSTSLGPLGGGFSYSTTGNIVINMSPDRLGVAQTNNWTYRTAFNIDTLDGNGPSGMDIDLTKLNVFQIHFRWLGAGELRFAVEDDETGDLIYFHHIHYTNRNTDVHMDNPSLKVGYVAANLSGAPISQNVKVSGASMMAGIEGIIVPTTLPTAVSISNTTNIGANTLTHVMTIKNRLIYRDKINTRDLILKNLNAAFTQASATAVEVFLFYQHDNLPALTYYPVSETQSSVMYSDTQTAAGQNGNVPIYIITVLQNVSEDLENYNLKIPPNATLSIFVRSTAQITRSSLALTWLED